MDKFCFVLMMKYRHYLFLIFNCILNEIETLPYREVYEQYINKPVQFHILFLSFSEKTLISA